MTTPALATIADLEERLGYEIEDEDVQAQAEARLRDASAIVRAYARETWLDDDGNLDDVPDEIVGVVATMVERASRNPAGVTQEAAGPFSRSFGSDAAARLYLTKPEKLVVRNAVGRTGLGVVATTRGELETGPIYDHDLDDTLDEHGWPL